MKNFKELSSFKLIHRNQKIVVCGCGESLNDLDEPGTFITIGISDVGRVFTPNYLLVSDYRYCYAGDRFDYIENSQAEYLFTPLRHLQLSHKHVVRFSCGTFAGTDFACPDVLPYTNTSAYMAISLAVHMGGNPIGLIGIDFTDNHFFDKSGPHPLTRDLARLDKQFIQLNISLRAMGIEVFNLSSASRISAFQKNTLGFFKEYVRSTDGPFSTPAQLASAAQTITNMQTPNNSGRSQYLAKESV